MAATIYEAACCEVPCLGFNRLLPVITIKKIHIMQRTILSFLLLMSIGNGLQAQFSKGNRMFGGSFSGDAYRNDVASPVAGTNVNFSPAYAWFVKDNLAMGIRGSLGFSANKNTNGAKNRQFLAGPSVFLTRYKTLKDRFGVSFSHELAFSYSKSVIKLNGNPVSEFNSYSGSYTFSPGVFYRFSEHFMGEAGIGGVSVYHGSSNNADKGYGVRASFLRSFNIGVNYVIAGKAKRNS
jgi:hypothetical protein